MAIKWSVECIPWLCSLLLAHKPQEPCGMWDKARAGLLVSSSALLPARLRAAGDLRANAKRLGRARRATAVVTLLGFTQIGFSVSLQNWQIDCFENCY